MNSNHSRVYMLDILRGIAVIGMVFHHALVSAEIVFDTTFSFLYTTAFEILQLIFVCVFLLVSGICTNYSKNIIKRGLIVCAAAAVVSFATCVVLPAIGLYGLNIYFGILHMFGLSMLFYGIFRKLFEKINIRVAVVLFTALFIGYYIFYKTEPVSSYPLLMVFGFLPDNITSYGDYYPWLPYFFMFLVGTYIGKPVKAGKFPSFFYKTRMPFFELCGKYSLYVYVLHQPVIFGVLMLISNIKLN